MRIFILEIQSSTEIDQDIFSSLVDWMPFLNDLIEPITDKKTQLAVDATHMVHTFDEYIELQKYYMAGQVILSAILTIVERTYRINNKNNEANQLPSEKLLKSEEMSNFLSSGNFENSITGELTIQPMTSVETATQDLLVIAKQFSETILNKHLYTNVESILNSSHQILKTTIKLEAFTKNLNDTFIKLKIESTGEDVFIYFNGSEEQFALLDKWLDAKELILPKAEDKSWVVSSPQAFLDWYNNLKLRLENECSFQTLMSYINLFDSDVEKYKANINNEIKKICESANLTDHEKRMQVVEFCNSILNKRKNAEQKSYRAVDMDQFITSFDPIKSQYLLNIYA